MSLRHFLTLTDLQPSELREVIQYAIDLKERHRAGNVEQPLRGKVLGMIFEKSSTRTRVSFEAGMAQLGGSAIFLSPNDTQLGRGEPVEDSARVISSMVDIIMVRTFEHSKVETFARHSSVPVINALTDDHHPCQLLADMQTYLEHRGDIRGAHVAWVGDGNNMCNSYIEAAAQFDFQLHLACPQGYEPRADLLERHHDRIHLHSEPAAAVAGANLVVTDTWASMGQETEKEARLRTFSDYRVDEALMEKAARDALFMHCLPAYRGMEISESLLDSRWSVAWDEAENRLHAQKALMLLLLKRFSC